MNVDSNPIPRWATLAAVVAIFFAFGALEAMDARTEALIAQADADAARAVAQIAQQHGIECGEPVEMLSPAKVVAGARL